ncbi:urease subunit beta [Kineosporia sp. A_224]|uniref:urease subunit beta n=1 Tax=Kineosporia sp. A_224 TaxID=1962180 RepID=UPI000B4B698F|nr:urease subunit beta [Kineosporia sp. A_224]
MRLTPAERDRLLLAGAAAVARRRRERGLRLNVPETVALVADAAVEAARDGLRLAEAVEAARALLGPDDVLPGVADVVTEVRVEAVFDDSTRLVVVPDPVGGGHLGAGAPGAVLPGADETASPPAGRDVVEVEVTNTATLPVTVTSHWHFFEANPRLRFDRAAAYGRRLDVPAGSAVRFDPGAPTTVALVPIGGARVAVGFAGLVDGPLDADGAREAALERAREFGYLGAGAPDDSDGEGR